MKTLRHLFGKKPLPPVPDVPPHLQKVAALIAKARQENFAKARRLGIKRFTLHTCGDGMECSWCKANAGREFGTDIMKTMAANCRCVPYSKCYINGKVEGF